MFISVLDLFKIGIGPSSSHTVGPMVAAAEFRGECQKRLQDAKQEDAYRIRCSLKGSLAHTGIGHGTDKAILLGLHGYEPAELATQDVDALDSSLRRRDRLYLKDGPTLGFQVCSDLEFDCDTKLPQHPNGMVFTLLDSVNTPIFSETYFSIGGGFINTLDEIGSLSAPIKMIALESHPYPFDSARAMLKMAEDSGKTIAQMKLANELYVMPEELLAKQKLEQSIWQIWAAMQACIRTGLSSSGTLPGGLDVKRRAQSLFESLDRAESHGNPNEWLCAYAMAVNEENAAGHMVVTAPTNGAAGVIPATLYYFMEHENGTRADVSTYLLTAAAIGGLIKHRSSISGAEVGCQGEVGSASAMAAAGLCAVKGGSAKQIENAAEMALEHHLGMTCDPVKGLVQVPCIERNGFGAIKAYTAASLALKGSGEHFMSLDNCIEAMRQTGAEMSEKFKETALGGLAQSWTEC